MQVLVFRFAPAAPSAFRLRAACSHTTRANSSQHNSSHSLQLTHQLTPRMALTPTHHTHLTPHMVLTPTHHTALSSRTNWLSCGRRSTQNPLEELLRTWSHQLGCRVAAKYTKPSGGAAARVAAAGPRLAAVWQAQYTDPSGGAAACVDAAGPRLAVVWQARYTELPGKAAACVVTHQLAVVWQPHYTEPSTRAAARAAATGPRMAVVWQAQYTDPSGRRWPAAGFLAAGAVHRAFWRSCCTHGRRWPAAYTPSFTHHLSHTTLSHTIFDTPSFTHHFVTHHL